MEGGVGPDEDLGSGGKSLWVKGREWRVWPEERHPLDRTGVGRGWSGRSWGQFGEFQCVVPTPVGDPLSV